MVSRGRQCGTNWYFIKGIDCFLRTIILNPTLLVFNLSASIAKYDNNVAAGGFIFEVFIITECFLGSFFFFMNPLYFLFITSLSVSFKGAKLPDPVCYGHTQFHLVPDRYHRDRMVRQQQADQVEVFLRANALASLFAWTGAQAMYQGEFLTQQRCNRTEMLCL